ncbi:MAG: twitching motility protein PilT [Clostridiales bacterium]|jgi:ABC-type proline/glycine betaine transport system ATPase subunit|nr:twitching motility protein PilT [Clostridiales bacterium]
MIRFIAGLKGVGKTKRLIKMVNDSVKTTDGHIVFIDDDRRHIYDLHYEIRFVETGSFPLSNYREFVGFVCGILSQDSDIKEIYVDGLTNIIKFLDSESLIKLVKKLEQLSQENCVDFIVSINYDTNSLPQEVTALVI